jgi:ribosomal protein S18 acetylase RimI-like enzyme
VTLDIRHVQEATPTLLSAMNTLVPQLSTSALPLTLDDLSAIVASPVTTLFVVREGASVVGTLTLIVFRIPSGVRAWIEDVIVDESARGSGAGEALTRAAISHSINLGARSIDLTSRPSREIANRLYQRLGFEVRETNVYRRMIEEEELE